MPELPLTSVGNPLVKRLRKLRLRKFREAEGVFLIEGIAHVRQAIDHHAPIEMLLVAPELLTSEGAWQAVKEQESAGTQVLTLGRAAFESIVERDHPSGLAATVEMRGVELAALPVRDDALFVALHDVGNPGNLGSIIRTLDSADGSAVIIVGDATDQYHPVAVKASMGALFHLPVARASSLEEVTDWAGGRGVSVVATSARARTDIWSASYELPVLLLLGSEATGLPAEILERCRLSVRIPMEGSPSSLNLAVAAGILIYEIKRRSHSASI